MTPMYMPRPKFLERIEVAEPGEMIVYHTGSLMRDRVAGASCIEINATACAAWDTMETGKTILLQRRIACDGASVYEYMALKLAPPYVHIEWFGPYATDKYTKPQHRLAPHPVVPAVERQPAYA